MMESLLDYKNSIKKVKGPRKLKITNSYGVQHAYRFYMKKCHAKKLKPLESFNYYKIIRGVNKLLGELILMGEIIKLPCRMGEIVVRKIDATPKIDKNGKLQIYYPIDWNKTLELWYEDEEARRDKIFVRIESKDKHEVFLSKRSARFENLTYYRFKLVRTLNNQIKKKQLEGTMSGFLLYKPNYG